jgi:hypothetical protein
MIPVGVRRLRRVAKVTNSRERDPLSFLPGVAERLGLYVYALRDPRSDEIYVGKGVGNRAHAHARHAQKVSGETTEQLKLIRIHRSTPRASRLRSR